MALYKMERLSVPAAIMENHIIQCLHVRKERTCNIMILIILIPLISTFCIKLNYFCPPTAACDKQAKNL